MIDFSINKLKRAASLSELFRKTGDGRALNRMLLEVVAELVEIQGSIEEQELLAYTWLQDRTINKEPDRSEENILRMLVALKLVGRDHICKAGDMGCACSGSCINYWVTEEELQSVKKR